MNCLNTPHVRSDDDDGISVDAAFSNDIFCKDMSGASGACVYSFDAEDSNTRPVKW